MVSKFSKSKTCYEFTDAAETGTEEIDRRQHPQSSKAISAHERSDYNIKKVSVKILSVRGHGSLMFVLKATELLVY